MAFTFKGSTPNEIKYNTNDVNVLKYNNVNVWGKPYALSISRGANTTVSVNRISSPNQHASTGVLSSGSLVYHGDVLAITASASSGYNLSTFSVNGTAWTSGNSITVSSAITVVTVAQGVGSWHTVWTGSQTVGGGSSQTFDGVLTGVPTRVYGTVTTRPITGRGNLGQTAFTSSYVTIYDKTDDAGNYITVRAKVNGANTLAFENDYSFINATVIVTSVEQYY